MGLEFVVRVSDADETPPEGASPEVAAVAVALRKAEAVLPLCGPDDVIIGADTTVVLDGDVLNKPADEADACRMLRALSGRTHTVLTGVVVLTETRKKTRCIATHVTFRELSDAEISAYVATGEPMDKAGAYGAQGRGASLIADVDGDFTNVVGLPVKDVRGMLAEICE